MLNMLGKALGAAAKGIYEVGNFIVDEVKASPDAFTDGIKDGFDGKLFQPKPKQEDTEVVKEETTKSSKRSFNEEQDW